MNYLPYEEWKRSERGKKLFIDCFINQVNAFTSIHGNKMFEVTIAIASEQSESMCKYLYDKGMVNELPEDTNEH